MNSKDQAKDLFFKGLAYLDNQDFEKSELMFVETLKLAPRSVPAFNNLAIAQYKQRKIDDAALTAQKVLQIDPENIDARLMLSTCQKDKELYEEVLETCQKIIEIDRTVAEAHCNLGYALNKIKKYQEAIESFDRAVALKPRFAEAFLNRGNALNNLNRYDEALAAYDKALALEPDLEGAWVGRGNVFFGLKRYDEALSAYDSALALKPSLTEAWCGRGNVLTNLKRHENALAAYDEALALKPDLAEAWCGRGNVFASLKRNEHAIAAFDKALALKSDLAEAWCGRGNVFAELKRHDEALAAYDEALALEPNTAGPWCGRGYVLYDLKRYDEALAAYDKALALGPEKAGESSKANALFGRGCVFNKFKRHDEAARAFAEAIKSDEQFPFAKGMLLHQKMLGCDWKDTNDLVAEIEKDVLSGKLSVEPFSWQSVAKSERSLQLCAELYNNDRYPAPISSGSRTIANHRKIRVGYSSGEFRNQATSFLLVGVFELHDDSRFEIYAIDNGWDDKSEIRQRINASVKGVIDISRLGDSSASAAIAENEIDILINLNGYFGETRMQVFAHKPAPIQVNYLGFPGTLGADYMDYIVADRCVIPENRKVFYREKVVYLPNCYQANDRKKKIGPRNFSRQECGLPEKGFVFCCFNNNYKITPETFDCWMRILLKVDDSVVWLIEDNRSASINLKKEAATRGVSPDRLVFAERIPLEDHLARHWLADLFLDTLPCNAHTTASDALWTGLPVLTQLGETFTGRVAASLLNTVGLPELITKTQEDYERLAIALATDRNKLALIKARLAQNRLTTPLFNTQLFTRHIEHAYELMYERHQKGLPPDHIYVPQ
jgi:protein O-GlcNAc transferase